MKKFLFTILLSIIIINSKDVKAIEKSEIIPKSIEMLDSLPIEETYSYEETLKILNENGYSKDYIKKFKDENKNLLRSTYIRYQIFTFDPEIINTGFYNYVLTPKIWVGLEYSSGSSPDRIASLKDADVSTSEGYGNKKCVLDATIRYNLISGREFQILVNGDLYKNGNRNYEGGVEVFFGSGEAYLKVSNGSGFIQDVYFQRDYYSAGLSK